MSNSKVEATFHDGRPPVGHDPEAMNKLPSVQALQKNLPRTPQDEKELRQLGIKTERKVMTLILEDGHGRRKYNRMLRKGWVVERETPNALRRSSTFVFRRTR